jgi:CHAT domain-containing protein/Tfp pilus assembly protein PilF
VKVWLIALLLARAALAGPPGQGASPSAALALAESLNHLGDGEEQSGQWAAAKQHELRALAIRQRLAPDSLALAQSLQSLGRVALDQDDLATAEQRMQKALSIRQKLVPGSSEVAASLIGLAFLYGRLGNLGKQEEFLHAAASEENNLTPLNRASISQGLGNLFQQRGQPEKAEALYQEALQVRQEVVPDSLPVASSLSDLGNLASNRGDLDPAEQYCMKALELRKRLAPDRLPEAMSDGDLGAIAQRRGDLARAEKYFRRALVIERRLSPEGLSVAGSLLQLGIVSSLREDLAKSESYIEQGARIRRRLAPESPGMAQSLNWLGLLAVGRGDLEQAESYFQQALAISEKISSENLLTAQMLSNLGDIAERRNQLEQARELFLRALAIQHKIVPDNPSEAIILQKLGVLARNRHDLPEAEKDFGNSLAIWAEQSPGSKAHVNALLSLAYLARQEHNTEAAAQKFEEAFHFLDQQLTNLGGDQTVRSHFRAKYETNFKDYIDLLISEEKQPEMAFNVSERSRARTLVELLESARVDVRHGCDPQLLRQERRLREAISTKSSYRLELLNEPDGETYLKALEKQIKELSSQYDEVRRQIQAEDPIYDALEQPKPLTAKEVQEQLLDRETILLEYSLGERRSFVWALTDTSLQVFTLPARKTIENTARQVYESLTSRSRRMGKETARQRQMRLAQADLDYTQSAAALSQMILGPVADLLHGKRMLIVGDGALQFISFSALPMPQPVLARSPSGTAGTLATAPEPGRPLVLEHEVVNLPSASTLTELGRARLNRPEPPKAVAVFADPVFDRQDERVTQLRFRSGGEPGPAPGARSPAKPFAGPEERWIRSAMDVGLIKGRGEYLGRLLWSQREAAAILKVTPAGQGMEALGFDANLDSVRSPALSQYRIVHFATHALLDGKNPERSGLVLSLVDQRGRRQDGFLDLDQIYNLNLPVDLVVLSACDTALGEEIRGEGLLGLARGFLYAGACRVMASLWNVDDEATSELMAHFYRSMEQDGRSPAAALRLAQIAIAKDGRWRSPFYWAAFQLQGEWK